MHERYERERKEILAVTQRMREQQDEGRSADMVDVAQVGATLASDDATINQDVEDMRDIDAARERLAAGTYGGCIDCGEAIAYERLLAYPTAKRCTHCQRLHEQQGAQRGISRAGHG
jgi:RNA polymerase-binding transcription factor DksA